MPLLKQASDTYYGNSPLENMNDYYNSLDAIRPYRLGPHHAEVIREMRPELMNVLLEGNKPYGRYLDDLQPYEKHSPGLNIAGDVLTDSALGALGGLGTSYIAKTFIPAASKFLGNGKAWRSWPVLAGAGLGGISGLLRGMDENEEWANDYDDFNYAVAAMRRK